MGDFMGQLSSYNLLNYLLSGVIFCELASRVLDRSYAPTNAIAAVFLYYFVGLVVSRFGSLVVEPALFRTKFVKRADHSDYVMASMKDQKIDILNEQNNVYRTLLAGLVLIVLLTIIGRIESLWPFLRSWEKPLGVVVLIALFMSSYRKQTRYIVRRVDVQKSLAEAESGEDE